MLLVWSYSANKIGMNKCESFKRVAHRENVFSVGSFYHFFFCLESLEQLYDSMVL